MRAKVMFVSSELLAKLLSDGPHRYYVNNGVPTGTKLLAIQWSEYHMAFACLFEHHSWDDVPDPCDLPHVEPKWFRLAEKSAEPSRN